MAHDNVHKRASAVYVSCFSVTWETGNWWILRQLLNVDIKTILISIALFNVDFVKV